MRSDSASFCSAAHRIRREKGKGSCSALRAFPAYVLRPWNCAQDVELLHCFDLVASASGTLSITSAGKDYLQRVDPRGFVANLRVVHGQDHSITVEYWPQEY
jgi:hypothetical protein